MGQITELDTVRPMLQLTSPRRAPDRLKYPAGSEAAMGTWIADIVPEAAAESLREALDKADSIRPVEALDHPASPTRGLV